VFAVSFAVFQGTGAEYLRGPPWGPFQSAEDHRWMEWGRFQLAEDLRRLAEDLFHSA